MVEKTFLLHCLGKRQLLVILTFLVLDFGNVRSFKKHSGIINCNCIAKSDIHDDANLLVWLQGHLSSFLLRL